MTTAPTKGAAPIITPDLLRKLAPTGRMLEDLSRAMAMRLPIYGLTARAHLAAFLAQTGHESGGFRSWVENLNYSADGLRKTWPERFPGTVADVYARQPERIACRAYASRMGNGDEASGDGWRFRGRGLIQTTGRANYTRLEEVTGVGLADLPAWLETPAGAVESAAVFWSDRNLNRFVDNGDFIGLTRAINGFTNGLADRQRRHAQAAELLGITQ